MNKKTLLFLTCCCSIIAFSAAGQKRTGNWAATNWSHSSRNCHHLLSVPAQCKWDFFAIKGNLEGTIVDWQPMQKNENTLYAASVAILQTSKEKVRILLLSNYSGYEKGQRLKIAPDKEPDVDTAVPLDREYYLNEEKKGRTPSCRINSYDEQVMKTTWGRVVNN